MFLWFSRAYWREILLDPELALFGCALITYMRKSIDTIPALMLGMVAAKKYFNWVEIIQTPQFPERVEQNDHYHVARENTLWPI